MDVVNFVLLIKKQTPRKNEVTLAVLEMRYCKPNVFPDSHRVQKRDIS